MEEDKDVKVDETQEEEEEDLSIKIDVTQGSDENLDDNVPCNQAVKSNERSKEAEKYCVLKHTNDLCLFRL